jgi:hypothetical protein
VGNPAEETYCHPNKAIVCVPFLLSTGVVVGQCRSPLLFRIWPSDEPPERAIASWLVATKL